MNLVALVLFLGVLGAVVARQIRGHGAQIWMIFGAGSLVALATQALSLPGALQALAAVAPVLLFLFALFVFAGGLQESGTLDHIARWLLGRARTPERLPAVLFVGFGIAAAFIVNDALVILAIPILFEVARRMRVDPKPLLLSVAFAVTVGSALTPIGNPQNLLVALSSGMGAPMTTFPRYLLLPVLGSLVLGGAYLSRVFARPLRAAEGDYPALRSRAPPLFPRGSWAARLGGRPVLLVFPAVIVALFGIDLSGSLLGTPTLPIWLPALIGAGILLMLSPRRVAMLRSVDVPILLLFVGLFLMVATVQEGGVMAAIEAVLPVAGPSNLPAGVVDVTALGLLGPQVVSNVPWVALQIPVLQGLGYGAGQPTIWIALAAMSTLAGNITLLGAASNLILVERAERLGVRIRLGEFVRLGLPVAAISVGLTMGALWFGV